MKKNVFVGAIFFSFAVSTAFGGGTDKISCISGMDKQVESRWNVRKKKILKKIGMQEKHPASSLLWKVKQEQKHYGDGSREFFNMLKKWGKFLSTGCWLWENIEYLEQEIIKAINEGNMLYSVKLYGDIIFFSKLFLEELKRNILSETERREKEKIRTIMYDVLKHLQYYKNKLKNFKQRIRINISVREKWYIIKKAIETTYKENLSKADYYKTDEWDTNIENITGDELEKYKNYSL